MFGELLEADAGSRIAQDRGDILVTVKQGADAVVLPHAGR